MKLSKTQIAALIGAVIAFLGALGKIISEDPADIGEPAPAEESAPDVAD